MKSTSNFKNTNKLLIWGSQSKSKIIIKMISKQEAFHKNSNFKERFHITGIFDPFVKNLKKLNEIKIYNSRNSLLNLLKKNNYFIVCLGNEQGYVRNLISEEITKRGLKPLSIISKNAFIDDTSKLAKGVFIMPNAMIGPFVKIGKYTIINSSSIIEHEVKIGNGCHIMSGATIGGRVKVGNSATLGMNCTIFPNVNIGEGSFVGAGAVIRHNVPKNHIVVGNPATFLKLNNQGIKKNILKKNLL